MEGQEIFRRIFFGAAPRTYEERAEEKEFTAEVAEIAEVLRGRR